MNANCSKCGTHLRFPWSFCPHCGSAIKRVFHPIHHERTAAGGGFGGMVFGVVLAPILIFPGVLLCLLGWGVVLGVPMIVLGIIAPLVAPVLGLREHLDRCPACGTRLLGLSDDKGRSCPACGANVAAEQNRFVKAG